MQLHFGNAPKNNKVVYSRPSTKWTLWKGNIILKIDLMYILLRKSPLQW